MQGKSLSILFCAIIKIFYFWFRDHPLWQGDPPICEKQFEDFKQGTGALFLCRKQPDLRFFFKKRKFWSSAYRSFTCRGSLALFSIFKSFFTSWRVLLPKGMVPEPKIKKFYDRAQEATSLLPIQKSSHPLLRDHKNFLFLVQGPSPLAGEPSKR